MNNNLLFEFLPDKVTHTIVVRREFGASLNRVWAAWTQPDLLDQWWAPGEWVCKTKQMSFMEGGSRLYKLSFGEESHWGLTTYAKIGMLKMFSGEENFCDEHGNINSDYPQSDYHIEFLEENLTTMVHHKTTYRSLDQFEASISYGFEEGMIGAFGELDKLLKN